MSNNLSILVYLDNFRIQEQFPMDVNLTTNQQIQNFDIIDVSAR